MLEASGVLEAIAVFSILGLVWALGSAPRERRPVDPNWKPGDVDEGGKPKPPPMWFGS